MPWLGINLAAFLVHRTTLNQMSHTSRGDTVYLLKLHFLLAKKSYNQKLYNHYVLIFTNQSDQCLNENNLRRMQAGKLGITILSFITMNHFHIHYLLSSLEQLSREAIITDLHFKKKLSLREIDLCL